MTEKSIDWQDRMMTHDTPSELSQHIRPFLFQNRFMLEDLPEQDVLILYQRAVPERRKRGDVLFRQGGFPKGVYWLESGKVKIFQGIGEGQRQTMYIYSDGDLIGYRQLIAGEPHPVSAMLLEDSVVRIIPAETFKSLIQTSPFFARNVLTALAKEFTVWMNRMNAFKKYPVRQRLMLSLLILHEQYQASGAPAGELTMTRTELAEFVGASLETIVRVLNQLKAEDLVGIHGRKIRLMDPMRLWSLLELE